MYIFPPTVVHMGWSRASISDLEVILNVKISKLNYV